MNEIGDRIKSTEAKVRDSAAIDFIDFVDNIRSDLLAAIVKPENRNHRGTLVYAIQSISCHDFFIPLFKVFLDSGFEVAMSIYQIFERQHFELDETEKLEANTLFEDYLSKLPESKFDFEDERKARIDEVLEWYCGDMDMEYTDSETTNRFHYFPVFATTGESVVCYRVFQNLKTKKYHVQSKDFVTSDSDRQAQFHRQLIELFSEQPPNSRIQGYRTAIEAIEKFDQEFD